jgi:hypothetical protein
MLYLVKYGSHLPRTLWAAARRLSPMIGLRRGLHLPLCYSALTGVKTGLYRLYSLQLTRMNDLDGCVALHFLGRDCTQPEPTANSDNWFRRLCKRLVCTGFISLHFQSHRRVQTVIHLDGCIRRVYTDSVRHTLRPYPVPTSAWPGFPGHALVPFRLVPHKSAPRGA